MFPRRLPWVAVGTGENLNEHVAGTLWPTKPERRRRLLECVEIMRSLWRGEEITHDGLGDGARGEVVDASRRATRAGAVEQWRGNCVPTNLAWELTRPEQFEAATRHIQAEEVASNVRVSADLPRHLEWLCQEAELDFDEVYLHHAGQDDTAYRHLVHVHVLVAGHLIAWVDAGPDAAPSSRS